MHKEWVRLSDQEEDKFWRLDNLQERPPKWRYIETSENNAYIESYVDVADENDEPTEDGLYTDNDGDLWVRLNNLWRFCKSDISANGWTPWDEDAVNYTPFSQLKIERN